MSVKRKDVVRLFRNQAELARILGRGRAQINQQWRDSDQVVPAEAVGKIVEAALVKGLILTPQMMRPDLWPVPVGFMKARRENNDAD